MRVIKWYGRAFAAVAGTVLLAQFDYGFYGWLMNGLLVLCLMMGSFLAGWLDYEPDPPEDTIEPGGPAKPR